MSQIRPAKIGAPPKWPMFLTDAIASARLRHPPVADSSTRKAEWRRSTARAPRMSNARGTNCCLFQFGHKRISRHIVLRDKEGSVVGATAIGALLRSGDGDVPNTGHFVGGPAWNARRNFGRRQLTVAQHVVQQGFFFRLTRSLQYQRRASGLRMLVGEETRMAVLTVAPSAFEMGLTRLSRALSAGRRRGRDGSPATVAGRRTGHAVAGVDRRRRKNALLAFGH